MPSLPVGVVPRFVDGYDGEYVVWSNGTLVSLKGKKPKALAQFPNTNGYHCVSLYRQGGRKTAQVHQLVATHFIPNPYNKPEVDHRDVNQLNNDVRNLRWVTHLENCQNRGVYSNNTTGVTGLQMTKCGTFTASIMANGKQHNKTFKTKPEAIAWYATMKATLHIA